MTLHRHGMLLSRHFQFTTMCTKWSVLTIAQRIDILQAHLKTFKNPQQYSIHNTTYILYNIHESAHICHMPSEAI